MLKTKVIKKKIWLITKNPFLLSASKNLSHTNPHPGPPKILPIWTKANPKPAIVSDKLQSRYKNVVKWVEIEPFIEPKKAHKLK